jgi:hypothetical protein
MRRRLLSLGLLAVIAIWLLPGTVGADDRDVRRRGPCSGGPSRWELRVGRESRTSLRIRFEIGGGAAEQTWQVFLSDGGTRIYAGSKVSGGGGEVRVRKLTRDRAGSDRIKASGVNLATGESCLGAVTY